MYEENDKLEDLIKEAKNHTFDKYISSKDKVIARLEDYLATLKNNL